MRKGGDQNQRKIGGREIKASEELYGEFSVTLSMPKSQVFPALTLPWLSDSLVTCTAFRAAQQLPGASAPHTDTGHPQFHFFMNFFLRPKLPILLLQADGEMFVLNWFEVLGLAAELTFNEKLIFFCFQEMHPPLFSYCLLLQHHHFVHVWEISITAGGKGLLLSEDCGT